MVVLQASPNMQGKGQHWQTLPIQNENTNLGLLFHKAYFLKQSESQTIPLLPGIDFNTHVPRQKSNKASQQVVRKTFQKRTYHSIERIHAITKDFERSASRKQVYGGGVPWTYNKDEAQRSAFQIRKALVIDESNGVWLRSLPDKGIPSSEVV